MVPNFTETHSCVPSTHASQGIIFHNLILHHSELRGHVHGLFLVSKHTLAHFVYDHLAARYIILCSPQISRQLVNLSFLLVLEQRHLVLFLDQVVSVLSDLIQFNFCSLQLLISICNSCCFFLFYLLDLSLDGLLSIACSSLEIFKLFFGSL